MIVTSPDKLIGATLGTYRLTQLIGQSRKGPLFLASVDTATTTYLLRFLTEPTGRATKDHDDYQERFRYQASRIASLQHPFILPLLDFGVYQGSPYLVSPYIPMRSLGTRLAKGGPLNILTAGRYLDQIAATLEYAHQHGIIHEDLSVDSIFVRLDGHLVVADFGVMSLLGPNGANRQRDVLYEGSQACTPEQLLGKSTGPYTDVYALGAVLYHMLAGAPVFPGPTPDALAQQHLYAAVPPLSDWRSDLPAGLYSIIARALAKDPTQRFSQPGALANAYNRNVNPADRTRMPFVIASLPTAPTNPPLERLMVRPERQVFDIDRNSSESTTAEREHGSYFSGPQTPLPDTLPFFPETQDIKQRGMPRPSLMLRFHRKSMRRTVLIAAVLLFLLIASSAIGVTSLLLRSNAAHASSTGQVTFFDAQNGTQGQSQALTIVIHDLNAPSAGFHYAAWLINEQSEQVVALGTLIGQKSTFSLTYNGASGNGQGRGSLLSAGDKLEVTMEEGIAELPSGKVVLVGSFPPQAFSHILHLLVSFPATPHQIGVLVGTLEQTHLLDIQASVLQNLATAGNTAAIQCEAQSMIDIIEGVHGSHYQPLAAACAAQNVIARGDGFGLLGNGYLADSAEHATLAISQPDATSAMHLHAQLMAIAIANIKGWVTIVEGDTLHLRAKPSDLANVQEIVTLADDAYHGVDSNGDGQIDPVAGEAGAITAYEQGLLMAALPLTASV